MKKALAGPAKRTAKKKPERRAMIAAVRRRAMVARVRMEAFTRGADRRLNGVLVQAPRVGAWTRAADRRLDRGLGRVWRLVGAAGRRLRTVAAPRLRWAGRRLRPLGVFLLRRLAWLERRLLRAAAWWRRVATRASAVLTPQRAICLVVLAAAGCLIASQFVDYRAVEIGQPGYAGLPAAEAPTVGGETPGQAHAYLLVPVALLAAALALAAWRNERRRGLGRVVFLLGLIALGVALLVDLPAGLDASGEATRFSGAEAVLHDGFYAQIAAAAGLMLGGALLVLAPRGLRLGPRVRLARAGPSEARTQGGRIAALFGRPRTPPRAVSAAARRARGS
jgi:hypothetical protein